MTESELKALGKTLRVHALRMVHAAGASHIGTCLSMADLLAVLYGDILRLDPQNPRWSGRDRFVLSKGHGAAIVYAALAERGFFPREWLAGFAPGWSPSSGAVTAHARAGRDG